MKIAFALLLVAATATGALLLGCSGPPADPQMSSCMAALSREECSCARGVLAPQHFNSFSRLMAISASNATDDVKNYQTRSLFTEMMSSGNLAAGAEFQSGIALMQSQCHIDLQAVMRRHLQSSNAQTPSQQATQTTVSQANEGAPGAEVGAGTVLPEMVSVPGQPFAAGRYEVTFAQWDACVAAGGCGGYSPPDQGWGRGNRPVINVNWNDAKAYVQWLSQRTGQRYRLLTSAEWEIAARAGATTTFSWGDQNPVCDQSASNGANFNGCNGRTTPVGSFQPNAFGLYDVLGNAWEWVEDCLDSGCSERVLRGGCWGCSPYGLGTDAFSDNPSDRRYYYGFRVARTL